MSDYENILKEKNKIYFQKKKIRVISFLKMKVLNYRIENIKSFIVDENFSPKIQQCDFYDSALF